MGRSVQPGARSGDGPRVSRRDASGRRRQGRALLLDVRPEVLLDGADAAGPRLRERRDAGDVGRIPEEGRDIRRTVTVGDLVGWRFGESITKSPSHQITKSPILTVQSPALSE